MGSEWAVNGQCIGSGWVFLSLRVREEVEEEEEQESEDEKEGKRKQKVMEEETVEKQPNEEC